MVSLSAIRRVEYQGVSTGLDAVERSLKAVSAAGDKVVQSGEAVTRTTERQEKRQLSLAGAVDRLQRQLDMAFRQQAEFERHQRTMNNALEQGVIDAERYGGVMSSLSAKYDYAGQAAREAAARVHDLSMKFDEGYASAKRMDQAVAELAEAERAGVRITGGYAAAIDAVVLSHDKAAQAAARQATELRALADAERLAASQADGQAKWNSYAGVNRSSSGSGAARDSAAVFEAAARAEDDMARAADNLRAKIDPLGTAQARMNAELAEYQQMLARGVITSREFAKAQDVARERVVAVQDAMQHSAANDNSAGFRRQNLGFQLQDIGVSLYGGMPAATVLIQQGSQILGIYQGNGGVNAALKDFAAIASGVLRYAGPVAAAAASLYGAYKLLEQYTVKAAVAIDDATKSLAEQAAPLEGLRGQISNLADLQKTYSDAVRESAQASNDATKAIIANSEREFNARKALLELEEKKQQALLKTQQAQLESEQIDLRRELAKAVNTRTDLQAQGYSDPKAGSVPFVRVPDALTGVEKTLEIIENSKSADTIKALRAQIELTEIGVKELGKALEKTFQSGFPGKPDLERRITGLPDVVDIGKERRRINELRDAEKERSDARIQGLRAVTDQEKIAAAVAAAGAGVTNSTERRIREQNAALEERARIDTEIAQGARDRDMQRRADLARQQQELDLVGKSVGEVARLQYQFEQLAAVKEEAARAGRTVTPEEVASIDAAASAIGRMTQQLELANVQRDLLFEREQLSRSPVEQRVASELRRVYGDDYQSQMNGAVAGQIRLNEAWNKAQDELRAVGDIGKDALGGLLDILYESGNVTEKLIGLFAGIGKQFAQMGLDRVLDNIKNGKSVFDLSAATRPNGGAPASAGPSVTVTAGGSVGAGVGAIKTAAVMTGQEIGATVAPVIRSSLSATNGGGTMADIIRGAADSLGTTARDLATVISYETGGKFSTSIRNPQGYLGLIQFGKAEQQKYGVTANQTFAQQMGSVVAFLKDRGFKPGMGILDLYSTINAGRPGRYNAVDGTTTVRQKVETQFAGHYGNADKLLGKQAVSEGVIDANRKLASSAAAQPQTAPPPAAMQQMSKLESLMSVGGAAIGAFTGGMQSGSPLMGGISGAFSGFGAAPALSALGLGAAAGPIGLIGGAILGIVGGIFGRNRQKKQERNQAQQQLNQNKSALEELFARGEGRGLGATTQSYNDFYDKTAQLDEIAQKAGDDELVQKLRDNVNKFFIVLEKDYVGKFKGLAEAYSSGLGSNSPFVQGAAEMEQLREEVKNFVADARSFGELQLKNKRDLTPEQLEARVAEAERAAQKMILANISGVRELGQVEAGLLRLGGVAVAAKTSLEQLGMTAEEAAKAVDGQLSVAIAKLKDNLLRDLASSLNDLSGVGFLNDIMNAQVKYQQRLDDASRLGIDGSLALRELSLSIGDIVKQAGLGASELSMLSEAFPTLQFMFNGASTSTMTLTEATSQLQAAYDKEASALDDLISASKSGIAAIKAFRDAMKINDSSPLSPADKVAEAGKQFRALADKAAGGDTEALGQLTQIGQSYLDEARSYYASSTGYYDIWKEVDATLARVQSATEGQLSKAEQQKRALDASVSGILDVNTSVKSVAEALAQYNATQKTGFENLAAQIALMKQVGSASIDAAYRANLDRAPDSSGGSFWQNQIASGKTVDQVVDAIANSREAQVNALYKQVFGRALDDESRAYWVNSGKSMEQIAADLNYAKTQGAYARGGIVGAYAAGGRVGNGLYNADSVRARYAGGGDIMLAGGEAVTRATSVNSKTWPTLDWINRTGTVPGNDNSAVLAELRALRQTVEVLSAQNAALAAALAANATKQSRTAEKTVAILGEVSAELKLVNSR